MPMPGGRTYDEALVDAIAAGVRHEAVEGVEGVVEEVRPSPDEPREHAIDPRVLDMTRKKIAGLIPSASAGGLMRHRHNLKETHFVTPADVTLETPYAEFGDRAIPVTVVRPANAPEKAPVLLFLHGGGFTVGWFGVYEAFLTAVAELAGCVVVFPEVRLAPENRFPAQVDDSAEMVDWVIAHADELGVDPAKLVVSGDSAGGSLLNATCLRQADKIALAISLYASCDIDGIPDWWSYDLYPVVEGQHDEMVNRVDNIKAWVGETHYIGSDDSLRRNPEISAVYASDEQLARFPRTVVVCSEYDYLRPQDERFAAQLAAAGVDVRLIRYAGMEHGFIEMTGVYPQAEDLARVYVEEIGRL